MSSKSAFPAERVLWPLQADGPDLPLLQEGLTFSVTVPCETLSELSAKLEPPAFPSPREKVSVFQQTFSQAVISTQGVQTQKSSFSNVIFRNHGIPYTSAVFSVVLLCMCAFALCVVLGTEGSQYEEMNRGLRSKL